MTSVHEAANAQSPAEVAERSEAVLADLQRRLPELLDFYRDLHAHPELSMQERRTAGKLARRLRTAGYEVTEGVGGNGVVGLLRNGAGPVVMLRTDMDALPIQERTGLEYASTATGTQPDGTTTPVMHACGHDTHMTALLATAEALVAHRESWSGTLFLCAQPAEETAEGAHEMLRDGLFGRFPKPDVALGQHIQPLPVETVGHNTGTIMSAAVNVDVVLHGKGAHGSLPQAAVDPVVMASALVMDLQTIRSRELAGDTAAVLTAGFVRAGAKHNVIGDQAHLGLNVRTYDSQTQQRILASIRRRAHAVADAFQAPKPPEITSSAYFPVTHNTAEVIQRVRAVHQSVLGEEHTVELPTLLGSEDFSEYGIPGDRYEGQPVPYGFWFFGAHSAADYDNAPGDSMLQKASSLPSPHQATFAPTAEPALRGGIRALTSAALAYLR